MMFESALYILAGIAFYGGAHQLYLGARQASDHPHVIHGVMYLLLCAFAVASALAYQADSVANLIPAGKLSVFAGFLLWGAFAWFVAAYTDYKPRLLLAALTVLWSLLLIGNIGAPFSLLYSDVTPISQTLPSGQMQITLHTRVNPWWNVVQAGMLASLLFSLYASFRLYRADEKRAALALGSGLLVLFGAALSDALVTAGLTRSAFLAPFGFLALLVATSVYPQLHRVRKTRDDASPASYNMTFHLNQPPPYRPGPAFVQTPLPESAGMDIEAPTQAEITHEQSSPPFVFSPPEAPEPVVSTAETESATEATPVTEGEVQSAQDAPRPKAPQLDEAALTEVSDNLIDIAVYATMAMNRFKRGETSPETLEALFAKVRAQAINTRRLANRLMHTAGSRHADDKDADPPGSR
ncbi:MAG: hypothetical protein J5I92_14110 [Thiogranum sp.]|nr:hypothetical protein [Thiogranum sp.]